MKILVTGSSGLVGSALVPFLVRKGDQVIRLVRKKGGEIFWDPDRGTIEVAPLEGLEAVVHLAGEPIAKRWSESQKKKIRDSRVNGTRLLSESIAKLSRPPKVMIAASAIGFYGNRGEELLTEQSLPGSGFLAQVCQEWESASKPASQKGIRVVNLRIGIVLSPNGGALAKMLLPFRLGLGGKIGSGNQYMSWISLEDLIGIIDHAIRTDPLKGAVNAVTTNPVTNQEFAKTLGRVLSRPTLFPMPAAVARLALGEMAEELLLASSRVMPTKLQASGYSFRHPELEEALQSLLV